MTMMREGRPTTPVPVKEAHMAPRPPPAIAR